MSKFNFLPLLAVFFEILVSATGKFIPEQPLQAESICYDNVGCFTLGEGPLGHIPLLPDDPVQVNHQFEFWTLDHKETPTLIPAVDISAETIAASGAFDTSLPVKVVCHGFADTGYEPWMLSMKDIFLEKEPTTVVMIDWEQGASVINYVKAARNAELVGRQLGNVIKAMLQLGLDQSQIHLIGHSLGAQIMNFAVGWVRQEIPDFSPARISGLDPANPFFCDDPNYTNDTFLEETDAQFVDIIHSNMGKLSYGHVGCENNLGHVDFYPNGGYDQPGCPNPIFGTIEDLFTGENTKSCSHRRSIFLYLESMTDETRFKSFPCPGLDEFQDSFVKGDCFSCEATENGCGNLGYFSQQSFGRGPLYLITNSQDEPQFAGHMMRISVTSSSSQEDITVGQFLLTIHDPDHGDLGPFAITEEDENILEGAVSNKVVLSDQLISDNWDFIQASFEYRAFDGFFVDGKPSWFIDRVELEIENGRRFYYCRIMGQFDSEIPEEITLTSAEC